MVHPSAPASAPPSSSSSSSLASLAATLAPLLRDHAPWRAVPLVPALRAPAADDELPLWQAVEAAIGHRVPAPFWAVPWPGAQALARVVVDDLVAVAGRVVVDVGCGSGLASIAAARAGAARVVAIDVDPLALAVTALTAADNGVAGIEPVVADPVLGDDDPVLVPDGAVVLAGDVVYNVDVGRALGARVRAWQQRGVDVVLADSGRPFFDPGVAVAVARFVVPVPVAVEGTGTRTVTVWRAPR
jgi:predicted nicotinamide N-methyase